MPQKVSSKDVQLASVVGRRTGHVMYHDLTEIEPLPSPRFSRICVLGVGLFGGSIALAALRAGTAVQVWDPEIDSLRGENSPRWVVFDSPEEAVADCELVVLAGPVDTLVDMALRVAPFIHHDSILTDVGSVKGPVSTELSRVLRDAPFSIVPGHPMAGRETKGLASADPDLFANATWLLTSEAAAMSTRRVAMFARSLGASRVLSIDPQTHDVLMSLVSHTPQIISVALAGVLGQQDFYPVAAPVAGGGFRDTTRLAASPWTTWEPIIRENRGALIQPLSAVRDRIDVIIKALMVENYNPIASAFSDGNAARAIYETAKAGHAQVVTSTAQAEEALPLGPRAWIDQAMGYNTVRTIAGTTFDHAVLACELLSGMIGVQVDVSVLHNGADIIQQVADLLECEYRETWTADGLFVRGVSIDNTLYVIP